ncbi:MAG: ABC transporter ATP-binding protein [Bacteroidota bacterium]
MLRRLNVYLWRYKHLMIPGLLCALVSAAFTLLVPNVVRQAVDAVPRMVDLHALYAGTPVSGFASAQFTYTLVLGGAMILNASLASGLFIFLMRRTVVVASRHIEYDLRNVLYGHLQQLGRPFYSQTPTGDVMTRATSDIEKVRRYVGPALMYAVQATAVTTLALTVMLLISPTLTFWALTPMPLLAISIFFVARMIHTRTDRQQAQYSNLTSRVQEALSGIRVVKAYVREDHEAKRFERESVGYQHRALDLALVETAFRPTMLVLIGASTILVVWVGGQLAIEGAITLGNIAEYIIYVAILTWPVASLGFTINMIQQARASWSRLVRILDRPPAIRDGEQTDTSIDAVEGRITFERVAFRFEALATTAPDALHADALRSDTMNAAAAGGDGAPAEAPWVLRDVSFDVPAGTTLGVVGRTGSGKTTLVELISRLLDASEGRVLIDGHDVRTVPLDVLRRSIGYVPQEVFLFSDTIGHNIAFGKLDATDAEIRQAAVEADLLGNIQDFPEGFRTRVGERGITLSGGQKQRTAIARALIRRPPILIFDDALSAVDTQTEARILANLREQFGQRTVVVVSHRISAVQDADQILVLDDGQIAEQGAHADLLRHGGIYAEMHRKQLLEDALAEA